MSGRPKRKRSSKAQGGWLARKKTRWSNRPVFRSKGFRGAPSTPSAGGFRSYTGLSTRRVGSTLPDRLFVKLKMQYDVSVTSTAGAYNTQIVAINSAYDPLQASGNAEPYMYTQYVALYERYRVAGLYYNIQPHMGVTGLVSSSARVSVVIPTTSSSAFSALVAREQPGAVCSKMVVNAGSPPDLTGYIAMHKLFGITKQRYQQDDLFSATTGANPSLIAYLHIGAFDPTVATTVTTEFSVQLTFYTEFYQRAKPAVSTHA